MSKDKGGKDKSKSAAPYTAKTLSPLLKSAQETAAQEFLDNSKSDGRNVSGAVKMRVIEVDEKGGAELRDSAKQSGYDENFRTSKKDYWRGLDDEFDLDDKDATFSDAFEYSRLPTNSYVHFRGDDGVTTGHSGGLIKPLDELKKKSSNKKHWKEIKEEIKGIDDGDRAAIRSVSNYVVKKLVSTQGEFKVGSLGAGGFHDARDEVIENVVSEARENNKLQEASPAKAATEALKFVINNTVGYRDNTEENRDKFKGITTTGLNLEDDVSREYAMKHYQAERDIMKLAVLKHEGRLNSVDSESGVEDGSEIDLINKKLQRTKFEEKYHGKKSDEARLSPVRADTPYSSEIIKNGIATLEKATSFTEISLSYATPVPAIKPSESLILAEEAKAGKGGGTPSSSPIPSGAGKFKAVSSAKTMS